MPPDAAITISAGTFATAGGGSIDIDATGKFTFTPLNGSTIADSYTYTATSNGVSATATINFTISNMIWYVSNTYGGAGGISNGSSHRPYVDVATAEGASAVNQIIYILTGSGNINGNVLLKSGQTLRGAGSALSVGALSIAAGTKPTLTGMIMLANNVTADGFDMSTGATTAITNGAATVTGVTIDLGTVMTTTGTGLSLTGTGNSVTVVLGSLKINGAVNAVDLVNTAGSVTINGGSLINSTGTTVAISGGTLAFTYNGDISQANNAPMVSVSGGHNSGIVRFNIGILSATNGTGLLFDNADGTYNFNGTTTLNGGDAGIDILNGSAGSFSFSANTSITNPLNEVIKINNSAAGMNYNGTFTKNNNAVIGIFIRGETSGSVNFNGSGTKILSTSTANAIDLSSNSGASINFNGNNLSITTTSGTGFSATLGGTVSASGTGNVILSTTGTALIVTNTTISVSGFIFRSISANGALNGIQLINTGASGGLTVTGDGSASNNGSGGTVSTSTATGISLTNAANISINYMNIQNSGDDGVFASNVTGFTMSRCNLTNNGNSTVDEGIEFANLLGTASITNCAVNGNAHNNFYLDNTSGTLTSLTISNSIFNNNSVTNGNHGFLFQARVSATVSSVSINGCTFSGNRSIGMQTLAADNSVITNYVVSGCTFSNQQIGMDFSQSQTASFNFKALNNILTGQNSHAINVFASAGASTGGTLQGTVQGNTVGNMAVAGSGSAIGNGMRFNFNGNAEGRLLIDNNTIRECPVGRGMEIIGRNGAGQLDATITNNNVNHVNLSFMPGTSDFPLAAIFVQSNVVGVSGYTVRTDMRGNTVPVGSAFDLTSGFISMARTSTSNFFHRDFAPTGAANAAAELSANNAGSVGALGSIILITTAINLPL
jgi:hypothetical protein